MPFTLALQRHFVADHYHDLTGFQEARHGHNWEVEAAVWAEQPSDETPFAQSLDAWVQGLDYGLLNELKPLQGRNPTAEALAEWAFRHLEADALRPAWVRIREKTNYWALCRRAEPE